jgi:predicted porin
MSQAAFRMKTLVGAAVLACAAHSAAAVELGSYVSIYGFINGQVESVEANGGATPYERRGRVSDGNSRIGFTGSIGTRADFKGVWQIEGSLNNFEQGGVNDSGHSATLESRNTFVGVDSARFGRLVVGNNDSIYRSLIGSGSTLGGNLGMTVHGVDVFNNTSGQLSGNSDSIFSRGEARYKNSVHYLSPEWRGLQGGASYGFDETQTGRSNRSRASVALKYQWEALTIGAGYDRQDNTGVDTVLLERGLGFGTDAEDGKNTSFAKVVASYRFPTRTTLGLGYEAAKFGYDEVVAPTSGSFYTGSRNGSMKQNAMIATLAQDFGDLSLLLGYGKMGDLKGTTFAVPADFKASQLSLGLTYNVDANFTSYVYFSKIRNHSQANVNLGQAPLRTNNLGTDNAFMAPGDSPRAIGVGLLARF